MREIPRDPERIVHIMDAIERLDEEEIWHTATRNIPEIRPQIAAILEELNKTNI